MGNDEIMLAVGRALMSKSRMMLLDEPSMGLAPMLVRDIFQIIVDINRAGTTILLVEQNAHMALSIASRAYVLETGRIILFPAKARSSSATRGSGKPPSAADKIILDGIVKSPDAALRFIIPFGRLRAGLLPVMVSLSNHARLACGSFYDAVEFDQIFDF